MQRSLVVTAALVSSAAFYFVVSPVWAGFGFACTRPSEPMCLSSSLRDEWAFNSCRTQVQNYVQDIKSYVHCLRSEENSAIDESNDVVRKFNCKADGKTCF